jgi:hypothetical protein
MAGGSTDPWQGADLLQRFAKDLQDLRLRAGNPDYRTMARRAGCAHSTLATADNGRKLPTLRATIAYVRACGAGQTEEDVWAGRWQTVNAQLKQPNQPPNDHVNGQHLDTALLDNRLKSDTSRKPLPPRRRRITWMAGIGAVLVIALGMVIVNLSPSDTAHVSSPPLLSSSPSPTASASPTGQVPVRRQGVLVMAPGRVADLDSLAPDWNEQPDPGPNTADIWFDARDHALHGVGNNDIAVLQPDSAGGFWPCALERHYGVRLEAPDIRPERMLCGLTAANRVAQLRVTDVQYDAAGMPAQVTFDVIVWVPPHRT